MARAVSSTRSIHPGSALNSNRAVLFSGFFDVETALILGLYRRKRLLLHDFDYPDKFRTKFSGAIDTRFDFPYIVRTEMRSQLNAKESAMKTTLYLIAALIGILAAIGAIMTDTPIVCGPVVDDDE